MTQPAPSPADVQATFCAVLVDTFVASGVRHAVIAPGSRSTPMALALAGCPDVHVQIAHDERTAGFMALGVGVATGRPAVVLCTSGTAAVHLHAAVVEAHLSAIPLVVLTADRPPELHDVGAPQTIDQQQLFGSAVRWFHDPGVPDVAAVPSWRSLGQRVVAAATGLLPGPVHLNLPFREPLVGAVDAGLLERAGSTTPRTASGRVILDDHDVQELAHVVAGEVRGIIVAGRSGASSAAVGALADALAWPVLVEPRSGCSDVPSAVRAFDALLRDPTFARDHRPAVVVRIGEPPASKVAGQWLASCEATQVHVSMLPTVIDPDHRVALRVVADLDDLLTRVAQLVAGRGATNTPWLARWLHAERHAQQAMTTWCEAQPRLTEPAVARTIMTSLPTGSHLVVASSMPIRDIEWFGGVGPGITVHANRGANGIDGVLATAVGVAWAMQAPTAVLMGDVALLHDASSLTALVRRGLDLRIVVVDNDGGGIFSFLPQATSLPDDRFEMLFGTPHGTDLERLAQAHHLPALTVTNADELREALRVPGPSMIRVPTDRRDNVIAHTSLNDAARPR